MAMFGKKKGPRGEYHGRLAFDPDSEFHTDAEGNRVVTLDGGKTWSYATDELSHNARYSERIAVIDSTANAVEPEPHHYSTQQDDDHYHPLKGTELKYHKDVDAPFVTSHTDSWL